MSDLPKGLFRLEGHIDVPADRIAQVSEALKDHINLTRAEAGCIFFNVDACEKIEGRFLVSEAFVNKAAFQFHQERRLGLRRVKMCRGIIRLGRWGS